MRKWTDKIGLGHDLVLIADYQVREHAETDGETSNN